MVRRRKRPSARASGLTKIGTGCKVSCVATLEAVNESPEFTKTLGIKQVHKRLWGVTTTSPRRLFGTDGIKRHYFCWPELRVKERGQYRLNFELWCENLDATAAYKITEATGGVFEVFAGKKFPGIPLSTELSLCFYKQGFKMKTIDPNRPRKARKTNADNVASSASASGPSPEGTDSGPATVQSAVQSSPAISPTSAAVHQLAQPISEASSSVATPSVQPRNIPEPAWTMDAMPVRSGPMLDSRSASPFPGIAYYNMPAPSAGHQPVPTRQFGAGANDLSFGGTGHSAATPAPQGGMMHLGVQGINYHLGGGNSFINPADLQYNATAPRVVSPANFMPMGVHGLASHHSFAPTPEMPSVYLPEHNINGEFDLAAMSTQGMQVMPTMASYNTEPAQQYHDMSEFVFDPSAPFDCQGS